MMTSSTTMNAARLFLTGSDGHQIYGVLLNRPPPPRQRDQPMAGAGRRGWERPRIGLLVPILAVVPCAGKTLGPSRIASTWLGWGPEGRFLVVLPGWAPALGPDGYERPGWGGGSRAVRHGPLGETPFSAPQAKKILAGNAILLIF